MNIQKGLTIHLENYQEILDFYNIILFAKDWDNSKKDIDTNRKFNENEQKLFMELQKICAEYLGKDQLWK